jgi:alpha-tubulin suppressor-like RCC1 family protein
VAVAAGSRHSCAILADRTIRCWGFNHAGQLGDGTVASRDRPVGARAGCDALRVAAGLEATCALCGDHTPRCWGAGARGELGDGTGFVPRWSPVEISTLAGPGAGPGR